MEVHLKSNGTTVQYLTTVPAGYMNRAARRRWKKILGRKK